MAWIGSSPHMCRKQLTFLMGWGILYQFQLEAINLSGKNLSGEFTIASAYNAIRKKGATLQWCKISWGKHIHPNASALFWKIAQKKIMTEDRLKKIGYNIASMCRLCNMEEETWSHCFTECLMVQKLWDWIYELFGASFSGCGILERLSAMQNASPAVKQLWHVAVIACYNRTWKYRNSIVFEDNRFSLDSLKNMIAYEIKGAEALVTGPMNNSISDLLLLRKLDIQCKPARSKSEGYAIWIPPRPGETKYNTDGAAAGNPGLAGAAMIARDSDGAVLRCQWSGLGVKNNFEAEMEAVLMAINDAVVHRLEEVWVECDNASVVQCCRSKSFPWWCHAAFTNQLCRIPSFRISHIWREGNRAADHLAKRGSKLAVGVNRNHDGRPDFLFFIEAPYVPYLRCK